MYAKTHTLLPGRDQDAYFTPMIVMRRVMSGCCSAVHLFFDWHDMAQGLSEAAVPSGERAY